MKKIFTFAAAILASVSMFAELPLNALPNGTKSFSSQEDWGSTVTKNQVIYDDSNYFMMLTQGNALTFDEANGMKIGNSSKQSAVVFYLDGTADLNITVGQNGSTATVTLYYMGETVEVLSSSNVGTAGESKGSANVTADDTESSAIAASACEAGYYKLHGSLRFCLKSIEVAYAAPSTDPVSSVVISGAAEVTVGESIKLTATTDVAATQYQWLVNGAEIAGATNKIYNFAPTEAGNYSFVCKAQNANNTDWVVSAAFAVVASEPEPVAEAYAYWQFSGTDAPDVNTSETGTNMTVEFLTSDDSKAFSAESAAYNTAVTDDMKSLGAKGIKLGANALSLVVTVTGGFLAGDQVYICGYKPWKVSSTNEHTGDIAASVATGSSKSDYNIGKIVLTEAVEALYLMRAEGTGTAITAIKAVHNNTPAAIENAEEAVKAVKFFQNGQLFIEMNGVIYNAQGAIVK